MGAQELNSTLAAPKANKLWTAPLRVMRGWLEKLKNSLWGYDFFISYHWASGGTYAVNLAARLQEKGYEVFIDRAEYAMGDDWKKIGEVALRNTQRLVLIATREAVFESDPVKREIVIFTDRDRHIIPIFFGDDFAAVEQANPDQHEVLARLPDATLYINDTPDNLQEHGPPTNIVEQLVEAHRIMRRRLLRRILTATAVSLLTIFAVAATAFAINSNIANQTTQKTLAEIRLQNGHRAIVDGDVGAGLLWYGQTLQTTGAQAAPAQQSARSLIAGWISAGPIRSLFHDGPILAASFSLDGTAALFSPDGRTLATAFGISYDRRFVAQLRDSLTGQPRGGPLSHGAWIQDLSFSPDSRTLAVAGGDAVRVWDLQTGQPRGEPIKHDGEVLAVSFSPDGKTLATSSYNYEGRGETVFWESQTGHRRSTLFKHSDRVYALSFSPDGRLIATASKTAQVWDVQTGEPRGEPFEHSSGTVAFGPDGTTLATGGYDNTARLWNLQTGRQQGEPFQHRGTVNAVSFSANGQTLATASEDGTAQLWDVLTGQSLGKPLRIGPRVNDVSFTPDNQTLATASDDTLARLWYVPRPVSGDAEKIWLSLQVRTGRTIENGMVRTLSQLEWLNRKKQLEDLGGDYFEHEHSRAH